MVSSSWLDLPYFDRFVRRVLPFGRNVLESYFEIEKFNRISGIYQFCGKAVCGNFKDQKNYAELQI